MEDCKNPNATRAILYTDTVGGIQTCRDDLWAVTTGELNDMQAKIDNNVSVSGLSWNVDEINAEMQKARDRDAAEKAGGLSLPNGCVGVSCDTEHQAVTLRFDHFKKALDFYAGIGPNRQPAADVAALPDGYAAKHVEGQGWIVNAPTGSKWIAYDGTPAGEFLTALHRQPAVMAAVQPDRQRAIAEIEFAADNSSTIPSSTIAFSFYEMRSMVGVYRATKRKLTLAENKLGTMRAAFHVNMMRAFPGKSHEEITAEIDKALGDRTAAMGAGDLPKEWGTWTEGDKLLTLYTQEQVLELMEARPAASGDTAPTSVLIAIGVSTTERGASVVITQQHANGSSTVIYSSGFPLGEHAGVAHVVIDRAPASGAAVQGIERDENGLTTYSGTLALHSYGEADDILFLSSLANPLAEVLQDDIARKTVTARYWITDKPVSKAEAQECFIRQLMGDAGCKFGSRYSEITGYLWTDEEVKIGGHDLMAELRSYVGKFLILEIETHDRAASNGAGGQS